jgi:streptogramin lyase
MSEERMKLKAFACAVLVVVALGPAVGQSAARGTARPALRLHDRVMTVAAPEVSATTARGLVKAHLSVTLRNVGGKSIAVSASDFAWSAQGDMFSAKAWNGGRRRVHIGPKHSRVFRLTFALPRAATKQATLVYRPADIGGSGSVPLDGSPRLAHAAASSSAAQPPTINTFSATGGVGDPWGTAIDSAGNVWFAEPGCDFAPTCPANAPLGQIGVIKAASHAVVLYTLPNIPGNQPIFLTFDGSGNLWFTTPNNSRIGKFDPSTGQFVGQWPVTAGSGPWDLTFAGGKLWYTEHLVSAVGSFDPSTHASRDFQTPTANSNPYGIAANGGLIWFTENNSSVDRIAVLDTTRSNAISEYPIVLPVSGTPHLIAVGAGGKPWWTEGWSNTIATLDPAVATPGQCGTTSGTCKGIQRFVAPAPATCSTAGTHTSGIAFQGSAELVWFDNSLTAQVGSFSPSSKAFAMNTLGNCGAHPHDGLDLDGLGNVWFDEEFANAIGELIPPPPPGGPTVVTGSSSAVGTTSATVAGSVNPNGQATTYHFDYGTSTSYGAQAPPPPDPSAGSGTASQQVSANLTGLSPGTTYHYRLVAANASGTQYGSDQTFVTASQSVPTITGFSPTSAAAGAGVTISGTNFTGATAVAFNGTAASYTVSSATQISATVPAGASSGPISVTTPAGTATSSSSFTVVSAGNGVVAADRFNRTVSGSWGAADIGGPWSVLDTPGNWSVTPGAGSVSVPANAQARAVLGGVAVQNVELLAQIVLPLCTGSASNCIGYVVGRYTGGSSPSYYRVGAVQGPGRSTVYLRAQRSDGSNLANDVNTGIPAAAGVVLWVRVQFQGVKPTAIRARIWPAGAAEPATWLLNTTDSTSAQQTAGAVGVRARNEDTAAARAFKFQSYQATALP